MLKNNRMIKRNTLLLYGKDGDSKEIFLGVPCRFVLKKDAGAASIMTAVIKVSEKTERLTAVNAYCEGELLFSGIPDEECYTQSEAGMFLSITARCNIALLLDNEVMPQEIKNPSLSFFGRKFLEPYGFYIKASHKKGSGKLKAEKGTSTYSFMRDLFRQLYNTLPVIKDDGSIYLLSEYMPDELYIDEKKIIKAEITRKNCDIVSEYVLPDSVTGAYAVHLLNPYFRGYKRKKYRDSSDAVDFSAVNTVKITLEGILKADIYDIAECLDEKGRVESIRYERTPAGDITVILFKSPQK